MACGVGKAWGWTWEYWWKEFATGGGIGSGTLYVLHSTMCNFVDHSALNKHETKMMGTSVLSMGQILTGNLLAEIIWDFILLSLDFFKV